MPEMEEQLRTETRITVEGTPYVLPSLDSFDLDEAMIMYRYSELTFDQIFELEGLHPGVVAGLLHVGIQRSDPALRERDVKAMVKRVNMMNVLEQLAELADQQPDPTQEPAQTTEPDSPPSEPDSMRSNDEATEPSGESSAIDSEHSPERLSLDSSGHPDSDTTADSRPETSEASLLTS